MMAFDVFLFWSVLKYPYQSANGSFILQVLARSIRFSTGTRLLHTTSNLFAFFVCDKFPLRKSFRLQSLPPAFVREHLVDNIPNGPIIISASGGHSWTGKIEKIGGNHYFTNGWENVVKDIPLDFSDFLIFHLVDPSTFHMTIFGLNGCERILPQKEADGDEVDEDVANDFDDDDHYNDEDVAAAAADDDDDYKEEEEEEEEEKENNDQVNGDDEENEDGDPFFTSVITKTHKSMLVRFMITIQSGW
ncbi:putative transcription factor B3-Domain family [Helianthus debilis subsp. tardiflorus]